MAKFAAKDSNKNITLSPHGTGKVVVGTGAADATVQSDGNHNLVLQTGNATTGSISITDGANGDIAITPDGTGEVDISKVDIDGGAIDAVTLGTNSAVTEAQIDNININGNAIISSNTDGNIDLTPNGTGEVNISKVDIDSGTIDGTTIATSDVEIGSGKTLNGSGTFDVQNGTLTTSTAQNEAIVSDGIPANIVAYTSAGSAPSGWSEYTSARGRMIVGLPASGTNEGTVGTAFTNTEDKSDSHSHTVDSHTHNIPIGFSGSDGYWQDNFPSYGGNGATGQSFDREWNRDAFGSYTASIPKTLGSSPGTNQATLNTSDFLAYIQLMAIKKD